MKSVYETMPTRVRIGSYWVDVVIGDQRDHETTNSFGWFNPLKSEISIREGMAPQRLANTFIHEVIHAMNAFSRPGFDSDSYGDIEEDFTSKIANGMCTFLQDNPEAASWWMQANDLHPAEEPSVKKVKPKKEKGAAVVKTKWIRQ